uniref:Uncharacterized protein n=1 Tax=Streptomyces pratensis (strain ATCC 33331 / IAF-45CD) TaxID=591167 RepID=A0A8D3WMS5_STRFA
MVRPGELGAGDIETWREIRAKSGAPAHPFMEPEFALAVGRVRPGARVAVISDESGGTAGFLPFERGWLGRGRAVGLGVSEVQGAVLRPGFAPEAGEVLRGCGLSAWEFDNLEEGQVLFEPAAARSYASYVIDVGDGYDSYEKALRAVSPHDVVVDRGHQDLPAGFAPVAQCHVEAEPAGRDVQALPAAPGRASPSPALPSRHGPQDRSPHEPCVPPRNPPNVTQSVALRQQCGRTRPLSWAGPSARRTGGFR